MVLPFTLLVSLAASAPGGAPSADTVSAAELLRPTPSAIVLSSSFRIPERDVAVPGARAVARPPADPRTTASPGPGPRRVRTETEADPSPQLIEYSDGYFTRLTVHKWASYLMLPLFVSEYVVGQKLIRGEGGDNLRGAHRALAGGIAGLFAVNTVTGGLNAIEAWKDPAGRNRRTIHGALMLLADAGFVITAGLAGQREDEGGLVGPVNNDNHRRVAIASMSTALIGYVMMLPIFGGS